MHEGGIQCVFLIDGAGVSNLPFYNLVNEGRNADVVLAFDGSSDE